MSSVEDRGFHAITGAVTTTSSSSWAIALGVSAMAIGGVVVVMWHGTRSGGFSRFAKSPTYFSPQKKDATIYAGREVMGAQRVPKGYRKREPEVLEVVIDPGRILDLETAEGERDFRTAVTKMFKDADPEDRPSVKGLLESSISYRGGYRARAVPFWLLDSGLVRFLREMGYDSAYASESHFQSLAVFDPKERTKIVARIPLSAATAKEAPR